VDGGVGPDDDKLIHINNTNHPRMKISDSYDLWAASYDSMGNKTRDIEAFALRNLLTEKYKNTLELGCGTGKNTPWLAERSDSVTCVDFSEEMLQWAKKKSTFSRVSFHQADITKTWMFTDKIYDLITCSLVLEHIKDLRCIFHQVATNLSKDGIFYLGELHPGRQYSGSKARFENGDDVHEITCYIHHISDFISAGISVGLTHYDLMEWWHPEDHPENTPRLLTLIFRKSS
jgi:ubiquinone/menaquinone biosynthesis C-methylase UbiE